MKRFLALMAGVIFVFGFAAVASADVTLTGEIKHWNWWRDNLEGTSIGNVSLLLPTKTGNSSFSMTRVRLGADIKVSDNLKGMIELESYAGPAGGTSDFYYWGTPNQKQSDMNIRQAWVLYTGSGLLGAPAGLKIGHQGLILGHGKFLNLTRYGTDAIVFFVDPNPQTHIGLRTSKAAEGGLADQGDDTDVYTGLVVYKLDDKTTIGANYTYVRNSDAEMSLQNLGLHAGGNIAGLDYKAEFDYQFGDLAEDLEQSAFGIYLGLGYKVDPVTLRASFAMGSGDDDNTDDENNAFVTFLGPDMNVAWIYEYQLTPAGLVGINLTPSTTGISNTTYYNLGLDYPATKDVTLSLDGYLFYATETPSGVDKSVGSEIDAKLVYKITKGLTWTLLGGYFAPGDWYEDMFGPDYDENVVAARSDITLSF